MHVQELFNELSHLSIWQFLFCSVGFILESQTVYSTFLSSFTTNCDLTLGGQEEGVTGMISWTTCCEQLRR